MNREILFRGKHIHSLPQNEHLDGTWVYGYLCNENYINTVDENEYGGKFTSEMLIEPETICQYTGLTDKNGRKIFEGDIVLFTDNIKIKGTTSHTSKVEWNTEIGGFVFHAECIGYYNVNPSQIERYEVEVIGNIFDNPELLKGDTENANPTN